MLGDFTTDMARLETMHAAGLISDANFAVQYEALVKANQAAQSSWSWSSPIALVGIAVVGYFAYKFLIKR
jgi:hypothetical protein